MPPKTKSSTWEFTCRNGHRFITTDRKEQERLDRKGCPECGLLFDRVYIRIHPDQT